MKWNKLALWAVVGATVLGSMACDKTMSDDSPLQPVYTPTVLMPTSNGIIYGLNASTGEKNWEYRGTDSTTISGSSDVLTHHVVVDKRNRAYVAITKTFGINAGRSFVECFEAGSGKYLWRVMLTNTPSGGMTLRDDALIIPQRDSLFSISINDGNQGNINWRWGTGNGTNLINGSVLLAENLLYFVTSGAAPGGASVYCLDAGSGIKYSEVGMTTQNPTEIPLGSFDARTSIGFGNNRIYVTYDNVSNGAVVCLNKKLQVLAPATDARVWTYSILSKSTYTSPLVYGDMVVVGAHDYNVHCIDGTAGVSAIRWKFPTSERINSSATVDEVNENVLVGSNDFNLYAINFVDGKLRWKFPTGSMIISSPVIFEGKVYFNSLDKYMYCVNAATGALVWKHQLNIVPVPTGTAAVSVSSPVVCDMAGNSFYPSVSGNSKH